MSYRFLLTLLLFTIFTGCLKKQATILPDFETGDVIFHTSHTAQSQYIQLATASKYSHMGIIEQLPQGVYVIEAVGPVQETPIQEWINRGDGSKFTVIRLKPEYRHAIPGAIKEAKKYLGLPYDWKFDWGDDEIYCSELVYKAFARGAHLKVCPLKKVGDYHLNQQIREKLKDRGISENQTVVSPQDIFDSNKFQLVYSNY